MGPIRIIRDARGVVVLLGVSYYWLNFPLIMINFSKPKNIKQLVVSKNESSSFDQKANLLDPFGDYIFNWSKYSDLTRIGPDI